MEFDATLEKESMEILFNLFQNTSKIVLFRAYYDEDISKPVYIDLGKKSHHILGVSQQITETEFLSHIHPNQIDQFNLVIDNLREKNKILDYEVQFFNSEIKKYIWIHILANYLPIFDENKGKKCLMGILEDITDIKNKESILLKKDEQLQSYKVISVIASMLMHRNEEFHVSLYTKIISLIVIRILKIYTLIF